MRGKQRAQPIQSYVGVGEGPPVAKTESCDSKEGASRRKKKSSSGGSAHRLVDGNGGDNKKARRPVDNKGKRRMEERGRVRKKNIELRKSTNISPPKKARSKGLVGIEGKRKD